MGKSFKERMAYRTDNFMSRGPSSIFLALVIAFLIGFALLVLGRFAIEYFGPEGASADTTDTVWTTFLALTDPGNMNQDNESTWFIKIITVVSGLFGIVFFSAVIAFITTQLDQKIEDLKKGHSSIIEDDHVLILGWNENIIEILNELIIANESEKSASVVILSEEEKEYMDDYLAEQIPDRVTTSIITRTGEMSSMNSLKRVAIEEAKSVIILPHSSANSPKNEQLSSDAKTLKTVLAILAACGSEDNTPDIVAEVFHDSNESVITELVPGKITIVKPEEMIAKITVQTSRTSGLASVYANLFGFDDCEFYFTKPDDKLVFGEAAFHYPDGVAIGVRKEDGEVVLRPGFDYIVDGEDELIMIAEDDSTIKYKSNPVITPKDIPFKSMEIETKPEKALILGWNSKGYTIVEQFFDYIEDGSEITIVLEEDCDSIKEKIDKLATLNSEVTINCKVANLLSIDDLTNIKPEIYDSVMILNTVHDDQEVADARSINILLLLRKLLKERIQNDEVQLISEVMNADNLELIAHAGVNDSIVSTKMISKILAQIAEEPDVLKVYEDLFREEGSEIYLKPLAYYSDNLPESATYADFIKLAQKRDEICIGFRDTKHEANVQEGFGIFINPAKDKTFKATKEDCLIVLAEDEN